MNLSVIIITKNEERNIHRCLESLKWAPEIIVADSHSSDQTPEIAQSFGNVKLIDTDWLGYSKTKSLAIENTSHDWILWLDADEKVTDELKVEIEKLFESPDDLKKFSAYKIKRRNWFMNQEVKYSGWQNDWVVRLFRKDKCHFDDKHVHESLEISGDVGKLKSCLNHYTYTNLEDYLEKYNKYNLLSARDKFSKTKKVNFYHLLIKPWLRFMRHYVLQFGFLDGKLGITLCTMSGVSVFFRYVKIWRMQHGEE